MVNHADQARLQVVDDLGTAPYCRESIIFKTDGLMHLSTTISSATFDIMGVSEIGLRSLQTLVTGFCFGRGVTSSTFFMM